MFVFPLRSFLYVSKATFRSWSRELNFQKHSIKKDGGCIGGWFLPGREEKKKGFPPLGRAAHGLEGYRKRDLEGLKVAWILKRVAGVGPPAMVVVRSESNMAQESDKKQSAMCIPLWRVAGDCLTWVPCGPSMAAAEVEHTGGDARKETWRRFLAQFLTE